MVSKKASLLPVATALSSSWAGHASLMVAHSPPNGRPRGITGRYVCSSSCLGASGPPTAGFLTSRQEAGLGAPPRLSPTVAGLPTVLTFSAEPARTRTDRDRPEAALLTAERSALPSTQNGGSGDSGQRRAEEARSSFPLHRRRCRNSDTLHSGPARLEFAPQPPPLAGGRRVARDVRFLLGEVT